MPILFCCFYATCSHHLGDLGCPLGATGVRVHERGSPLGVGTAVGLGIALSTGASVGGEVGVGLGDGPSPQAVRATVMVRTFRTAGTLILEEDMFILWLCLHWKLDATHDTPS